MAPRSAKRLVGKTPTRSKSVRKKSPKRTKVISFKCYTLVTGSDIAFKLHFFPQRKEAVQFREDECGGEGHINTITVTSNEDLVRVLSENVL